MIDIETVSVILRHAREGKISRAAAISILEDLVGEYDMEVMAEFISLLQPRIVNDE